MQKSQGPSEASIHVLNALNDEGEVDDDKAEVEEEVRLDDLVSASGFLWSLLPPLP